MGKYIVENVAYLTPSILRLSLSQREGQIPISFLPGQYAAISVKKGRRKTAVRCFSIASSPINSTKIEFGIRIGGKYTRSLTKLSPGYLIDVLGPFGNFTLDPSIHKNVVFCAGGIGITPFMSMIRYATEAQLDTKISLVVSARSKEEVPYLEELQQLVNNNKFLSVTYVVGGQEMPSVGIRQLAVSGRVTSELLNAAAKDLPDPTYFICGPPPFMDTVVSLLDHQGVVKGKIITEAFAQGKALAVGDSLSWPSTMYLASVIGAFVITAGITVNSLLKNITPTLLPDSLLSDEQRSSSARQKELDDLVNALQANQSSIVKSPGVIAAEQKSAANQTANTGPNTTATAPTSTQAATPKTSTQPQTSSQPSTVAPAAPASPVCTTSASGTTTCR